MSGTFLQAECLLTDRGGQLYRDTQQGCLVGIVQSVEQQAVEQQDSAALLKAQYELFQSLPQGCALEAQQVTIWQHQPCIIFTDPGVGYQPLQPVANSVTDFLALAVALTRVLKQLHSSNVLLLELNPESFLFDASSQQARLVQLHGAQRLLLSHPRLHAVQSSIGDPRFQAPELTGHLDIGCDVTADLYALGGVFYWLYSGQLAVGDSQDELERLHSQLAKLPKPLDALDEACPAMLSQIVMRLLAKNPADRYQSAQGLLLDLLQCQQQWQAQHQIPVFELATKDSSQHLQVSHLLYGRKQPLLQLQAAITACYNGQAAVVTVAG